MWKIIQQLLPFLIIVLLITQFVIPIIFGTKTWWLFRRNRTIKSDLSKELEDTERLAKYTKEKSNIVKDEASKNLNNAKDLKDRADNLL